MRRSVLRGTALVGIGIGVVVALRLGGRARKALRRNEVRAGRRLRYLRGRLQGERYRRLGFGPDPDVADDVLADRVRSALGPVEARLDLPRVHVMSEHHVVHLHGDVATRDDVDQLEDAVSAVAGVVDVRSHLHVGLLPGDTRPSTALGPE